MTDLIARRIWSFQQGRARRARRRNRRLRVGSPANYRWNRRLPHTPAPTTAGFHSSGRGSSVRELRKGGNYANFDEEIGTARHTL